MSPRRSSRWPNGPPESALRTAVPSDPNIVAFNDAVAPIQRELLVDFGLSELLPKARARAAA
jgi:hypothetical protein